MIRIYLEVQGWNRTPPLVRKKRLMKCTPGISERRSKFILHIIWCLFQATQHFRIWIFPIYETASAGSKFPSSIMFIILKEHSVTPPGLFNLLYSTHFQILCRNDVWKWPVNGCAVLHPSDFCGLILTEEGVWWGPHLGKLFPPHNGQRQISPVPEELFSKLFFRVWKIFLNSRKQALSPTTKSGFGKGSEIKKSFTYVPSSHEYSHIFDNS